MSKRFTESDKWQDPWFCELPPSHKLAWLYMLDACDAAGVIDFVERIANFMIGIDVPWSDFFESCGDRIETLDSGKLWIVGFVKFQVPNGLTRNHNPHKPAIRAVEKHGLNIPINEPKAKLAPSLKEDYAKAKPSLPQACPKLEEEEEVEREEEAEEEEKKRKPKKTTALTKKETAEAFAVWYAAYPKRVKPRDAERAYAGATKRIAGKGIEDPRKYLLARTRVYAEAKECIKDNAERMQFVPYPASWLNAGSYDDDPKAWKEHRDKPRLSASDEASIDFMNSGYGEENNGEQSSGYERGRKPLRGDGPHGDPEHPDGLLRHPDRQERLPSPDGYASGAESW